MTDALDFLQALAEERYDGAMLRAHLRHLKKQGEASQEDVNEVDNAVEHLGRMFTVLRLRIERQIKDVELEQIEEDVRTAEARAVLKERGVA